MAQDIKQTLNLPKTSFPMRGNLVEREPKRLAHWNESGLYGRIREKTADGPRFVLHDGPPFTNGGLHLGHALNKTLKDTILRYKWMRGFNAPYVPGWDSHGLPIEHKVSKELREAGRTDYSPLEVREASAEFADRFRRVQEEQFRRLGVLGDWQGAYWTIRPEYEAVELETFAIFVEAGLVYRSKKPVYWSIPCETALAEAEIEYRDHKSPSIYVRFPLAAEAAAKLGLAGGASVVIWTTTPWTLPANLAVAVHPDIEYVVLERDGDRLIVAAELADAVVSACGLDGYAAGARFKGAELEHLEARHPFIDRASPVVAADYVTTDAGTGCVHTAPGHGLDDYHTGLRYGLEIYCPVDDHGRFVDDGRVPAPLAGLSVLAEHGSISDANKGVLKLLSDSGTLLKKSTLQHSYPHCWRSKTPVIFRALDQWFIALDVDGLRGRALAALDKVDFVPDWGANRIRAAVENRPDWCISRQRSWGVPIPAFYDGDGKAYLDAGVVRAIAARMRTEGSDLWFKADAAQLLDGVELPAGWPAAADLRPGRDTLDVWIDSGCSHRAVLQRHPELGWPADLYLEGSDQHRGWFQSSLWTSVIADGAAPYREILTHGFIVKEDGTKLSKSDGEARPLTEWIDGYGADIIRLWICSQDFRGDVPVSDHIVGNIANNYRTIRNTLRFLAGNLHDFEPATDAVAPQDLHALDQWALHHLGALVERVTAACEAYEFHRAFHDLNRFCSVTLSAAYHDILKDRLYTRAPGDPLRRSSQTALEAIFSVLCRLLAPIIPFTADEAWAHRHHGDELADDAVALADWPARPAEWRFEQVAADIDALLAFKEAAVNPPLEALRQDKRIGQSLDAGAVLSGAPDDPTLQLLERYAADLPELFILSQVQVVVDAAAATVGVKVAHADGVRCPRCWRWVPELVGTVRWGEVSPRCREALGAIEAINT